MYSCEQSVQRDVTHFGSSSRGEFTFGQERTRELLPGGRVFVLSPQEGHQGTWVESWENAPGVSRDEKLELFMSVILEGNMGTSHEKCSISL